MADTHSFAGPMRGFYALTLRIQVTLLLGNVADLRIADGPPMLRSENARLSGWGYVDIRVATCLAPCRTCSAR